jgi:hypothetical protein
MVGAMETATGPVVAPDGIVHRIKVLPHLVIVSGNPLRVARLAPCVEPKLNDRKNHPAPAKI